MTRYCIVLAAALGAGCGRPAGPLPLPAQRHVSDGRDPGDLGIYIDMGDPFAAEYVVRDISPEKSNWRWAFVRPELKVRAPRTQRFRFAMEFAVPEVTFRVTGPVRVTCYLDGKSLGPMPVHEAGRHRYERPVPPGWVQPGATVSVTADVDKRYIAKDDGAQLSFLLSAAGFVE